MAMDERRRIAHLLRRTGFAATPDEIDHYTQLGFDAALDELLHPERIEELELDASIAKLGYDMATPAGIASAWIYRMINTRRPLAEKMALFWHGHFATSIQKVKSATLTWAQYELLRDEGLGKFGDLTLAIAQDPAMLVWLDNWKSKKEDPNENFGRELLELFTLGVGNYTEDDVKASARSFTGWSMLIKKDVIVGDEDVVQPALTKGDAGALTPAQIKAQKAAKRKAKRTLDATYLFRPTWHDDGPKTFLGVSGALDGADIIATIMKQPANAAFIAGKLFSFFVWDQPDKSTVAPFADIFTKNGGDIRATLEAILKSDEFSSDRAYRAKVRGPIEFAVAVHRLLGIEAPIKATADALESMGQVPFLPLNVGGWTSGLGWIGPSAMLERYNLVLAATTDKVNQTATFFATLAAAPGSTTDLVNFVVNQLLDGDLDQTQHDSLAAYLDLGAGGSRSPFDMSSPTATAKLAGLIRMTAATPDFQRA